MSASGNTLHLSDTDFEIHKVVVGPMDNNVFVLRCRHTGDAVLVDAANEHERLLELARALGVRRVVETHGHWDHVQAIPEMRDAGYSVSVTTQDAGMLPSYDEIIDDDEVIAVGDLRLRTIHTPGHTPGSQCFLVDGKLVAGDTLFLNGCGRTDLPGSDPEQMYYSLTQRLGQVPDDAVLYPGHLYSEKPSATMAETRRRNVVFRPQSLEQWLMMFGR